MYSPQTRPPGYGGGRPAPNGLGMGSTKRHSDAPGGPVRGPGDRNTGTGPAPALPRQAAARSREDIRPAPKSATELDRSARTAHDEMRELLKSQPPWSREVEQQRQKTRNYHQTLLFNHPIHPLAQSLDPLWVRTSYSLIVAFRDHVARAEAAVSQAAQGGGGGGGRRAPRNSPAEQELRKVLTRFRQALASEEGFYRQLVVRLVRFFGLGDACKDAMVGAGMVISPYNDGGSAVDDDAAEGARLSRDEKKEKVALVYKAMVSLGDIERYKEQYSDGYRREKLTGQASGAAAEKNGQVVDSGEERFGRARTYYDAARSLVPEDGSALNQLAVISTYLNDDFATIYYYIRALAIRVPFKGIGEILEKFLKKAFDRYTDDQIPADEAQAVRGWKLELGALISVLYRQNETSHLANLHSNVLTSLSTLVSARRLPSESIVRLTVVAIGLHWNARNLASVLPSATQPQRDRLAKTTKSQQAEETTLNFLLCVFIALMSVSAGEVEEVLRAPGWVNPADSAIASDEDGDDARQLHLSISAVLRRILPALRLISKWIKLHLDYISAFPLPDPNDTASRPGNGNGTGTDQGGLSASIPAFWSAYYRLIEALARTFPLGVLPSLEYGLEEDDDMRGFLPISRGLLGSRSSLSTDHATEAEMQVHPNEEQLMRIADLQVDATLILQAQTSGSQHIAEPPSVYNMNEELKNADDDHASVSTETEDDPVSMAMRASLARTDTPGHDVPMIDSRRHEVAPQTRPFNLLDDLVLGQPAATVIPRPQPLRTSFSSPRTGQPTPTLPTAAAGSPGLLFGGGGEGIWSMTREESSSQKGVKRATPTVPAAGSPGVASMDTQHGMSRPVSEQAKGRIGGQGVKALWDAPMSSLSQAAGTAGAAVPGAGAGGQYSQAFSSPFGNVGFGDSMSGSGVQAQARADRRTSGGGIAPPYNFGAGAPPAMQNPAPVPMSMPVPLDAAQLFAGISSLGLGSSHQAAHAQGWYVPPGDHGVIGRPTPAQPYTGANAQHRNGQAAYGGAYGQQHGTWG